MNFVGHMTKSCEAPKYLVFFISLGSLMSEISCLSRLEQRGMGHRPLLILSLLFKHTQSKCCISTCVL